MGATIHDEFTGCGKSAQHVYILRNKRDGLCITCGGKRAADGGNFCSKHRDFYRAYYRKYNRERRGMVR
jgi:hypothetical protein